MKKMKRKWIDIQQDTLMFLFRPLVYIWMRLDAKRKVVLGKGVSFTRKEPYIMLANHTFMFDVIHVPLRFRKVPYIVANQTLFKKKATRFLVSQVAHVISKQKGQSDAQTVRDLITAVKKGYPILIFPEGDTTFFGQTGLIEPSTMKLIKKLELDVITCNIKGGYLSKPRWATAKRKHRMIELHYELTFTKDDIKALTVEQISERIKEKLFFDAYAYQRKHMIKYEGKNLAQGFEDVVYVCPECQSIHTITTNGNTITCTHCHTQGYMDDYGFIKGFKFDNLIEWNDYQRTFSKALREHSLSTTAELFFVNEETLSMDAVGKVTLTYNQGKLILSGGYDLVIDIQDIKTPTLTMRRDLAFFYHEKNYLFKLEHYQIAFIRILQDKY